MAGNYPDVPSWRMAYDRDGTQVFDLLGGSLIQLSSTQIAALDNETLTSAYHWPGNSQNATRTLVFIFPEKRDLDGFYASLGSSTGGSGTIVAEVSTDTTNGLDGTWTSIGSVPNRSTVVQMRSGITANTSLGIIAVRFKVSFDSFTVDAYAFVVHLYGEPSPGENLQRLELWHPTLDERVPAAYFDWGDVPRSSTADKQFRVKNMHGSLTAHSIRVAQEALTDTTPSVPGQFTISQGGSFAAQQNIGDLAPGAISGLLTLRRITPSNAVVALWWHRLFMQTQGGWS